MYTIFRNKKNVYVLWMLMMNLLLHCQKGKIHSDDLHSIQHAIKSFTLQTISCQSLTKNMKKPKKIFVKNNGENNGSKNNLIKK